VPEDLPLPSDPKTIFLGGLFAIEMLAAAIVAREIVVPFVVAILLKLLLQPAFRILERLRIPRTISALLLILRLFGTVVGLGTAISSPARTWAAKLPQGIPRLQERLHFLREPVDDVATVFATSRGFWRNSAVSDTLVSGDIFLHRLVEILPSFRSKRQVVEISQQSKATFLHTWSRLRL
jgi:predicted PurR-regulated permease PerM